MAKPMAATAPSPRRSRRTHRHRNVMLCLSLLLLMVLPSPCFAKAKRLFPGSFKMPTEDPYKVLGVSPRANASQIKKAYHQKARDSHPDKNPELDPTLASDNFRRIVQAFELLSDPTNKRTYDLHRNQKNTKRQMSTSQQKMFTRQQKQGNGYTSQTFTQTTFGSHNQKQQQQQQQKSNGNNHQKQKKSSQARRAEILQAAKAAQKEVLKLSTLEQLDETLLDRQGRFTKHFFCVFVAGKKMEHFVTEQLLFPYPFSGTVGKGTRPSQVEWESILQTAKVRYNGPTPLTQAFRVPSVEHAHRTGKPYVVFARKGETIDQFQVYRPKAWMPQGYAKLEDWVRKKLTKQLTIVNYHHAPIQIFTMDGKSTATSEDGENILQVYEKPIPSGHQMTLVLHMGDRILAMDENVDKFPGSTGWKATLMQQEDILQTVVLEDIVATSNEEETVEIGPGYGATRRCYDLSVHCHSWVTQQKGNRKKDELPHCEAQVEFAHNICPKSCGVCVDAPWNGLYYTLFHVPLHKVPTPVLRGALSALRSVATFMDVFLEDFQHVWSMRRNVAVGFFFVGLIIGVQVVILGRMLLLTGRSSHATNSHRRHLQLQQAGVLFMLTVSLVSWGFWMSQVSPMDLPPFMRGFQRDLLHLERHSMDAIYALLYLGFLAWIVSSKLAQRSSWNLPTLILLFGVVSTLMLLGATYLLQNDNILVDGKKNHRLIRWIQIWKLRKNVAVSVFVVGSLLGSFVLAAGRFIWQTPNKKYIGWSLLNVSILVFGATLAFQDRYFATDLDHVLHLRMSAAVPCAVLGMIWGVGIAHFVSTYQVKVKVD